MTGGGHLACALPRAAVSGEGEKRVPHTHAHTHIHRQARAHTHTHGISIRRVDRRVDTAFNRSVLKKSGYGHNAAHGGTECCSNRMSELVAKGRGGKLLQFHFIFLFSFSLACYTCCTERVFATAARLSPFN